MQKLFLKNLMSVSVAVMVFSAAAIGSQESHKSQGPQKFEDLNSQSQGNEADEPRLPKEDQGMPAPQGESLDDQVSSQDTTPTYVPMSEPLRVPQVIKINEVSPDPDDEPYPPMSEEEDPNDPTSLGDRKGGRHKGAPKFHQKTPHLKLIPIIRMGEEESAGEQRGFTVIKGWAG